MENDPGCRGAGPQRLYVPGDPWLYFKFYSGPQSGDKVLSEIVAPTVARLFHGRFIDSWFFVRYQDPHTHIRVRFHTLSGIADAMTLVHEAAKPFVDARLLWKIQTDTYIREIERYGPSAIQSAERLFCEDSQMIVDVLPFFDGDDKEELRWLFCLRSMDRLLEDFGYDLEHKQKFAGVARQQLCAEFGVKRGTKDQLDDKYRRYRNVIARALGEQVPSEYQWIALEHTLRLRSARIYPIAEEIHRLMNRRELTRTIDDLLASYIHMSVNRLVRAKQRMHEMVLYDFLDRHYLSVRARYGAFAKQHGEKSNDSDAA
jgi:lantibiotic biosynthesis protein